MSLTHEQVISNFLNGQDPRAGSLYSENGVLYSYGSHFPLAKLDTRIEKYLVKETSSTNSTNTHRAKLLNHLSSHRYILVPDPLNMSKSIEVIIKQIQWKTDEIVESKRKAPRKLSDLQELYLKLALISKGTGDYIKIADEFRQLGSYEELKKYVIGLRVAYILKKSTVAA